LSAKNNTELKVSIEENQLAQNKKPKKERSNEDEIQTA
jgi:hypothetical protein